ncbi:hypothetical protein PPACK8108_LOCUS19957 [Phakopsora pachyrhizi]|uniref:Uncharacterized protein n=1 Tax=Phakopsora pachyrhizi TaxID=170000 RepID=A0AAV0BER5_PHAPC|nr:hypothetical protein PPACK8108_LOCUS19957 [Phakopsora pachyrhizi]
MDSYSTEDSSRIISKVSKLTTVVVRFNQSSIKLIYPINFISKHWINLGLEPIGSRKNLDCDDCLEFYEEHHKINCGDSINKDYLGWNTVIKSELKTLVKRKARVEVSMNQPKSHQSTEFLIRLQVRNSSRGIEDEVLKVFDRLLEEEVDKITFNLIRVSTNHYRRIPDGSLTSKSEESSRTQGRDYFVKISNGTDESRKFLVRGEEFSKEREALRKSEPTADQPEGLCEFLLKMLPDKVLRYSHFWHISIIFEKVCDRFSMAMMEITSIAPLGGLTDKSLASDGKRARVSLQSCKIVMSRSWC